LTFKTWDVVRVAVDNKDWLHARDACGSQADCIDDLQWRRVDELTQE
jgi:hypothetical protein